MCYKISTDPGKIQPRILYTLTIYRDRYIFVLDDRIAAFRLIGQYIVILPAIDIELVSLHLQEYSVFEVEHVEPAVIDGDFGCAAGIQ